VNTHNYAIFSCIHCSIRQQKKARMALSIN